MSDHKLLEDPTNRIVSVFDDLSQADAARQELLTHGITDDEIRVMRGEEAATKVDTSAKWFADTDVAIEKYQRELRAGKTVVSVPVQDRAGRDTLHAILERHGARLTTHFGEWVTEMIKRTAPRIERRRAFKQQIPNAEIACCVSPGLRSHKCSTVRNTNLFWGARNERIKGNEPNWYESRRAART